MASTTMDLAHRSDYAALSTLLLEEGDVPFTVQGRPQSVRMQYVVSGIESALARSGRGVKLENEQNLRLVLNLTSCHDPTPYRRRSRAVFVASLVEGPPPTEPLKACYPYLIRTLSNVLLYVTPGEGESACDVHFITPERGHVHLTCPLGGDDAFFRDLVDRLLVIASSHLVIENEFDADLPQELWEGDEHTRSFLEVGQHLDALNLLPAPFDLEELLTPEDMKHLRRIYKMGGLSHGNMSQRFDDGRFWMSASGVDKSAMREVGRDILLVKGFSPERLSMRLSVPPHVTPRRVSVDAIEHWMIYTEHPGVGAILHVHAWMEGIVSTPVPFPCGTVELAHAVASLIRQAPEPEHAVIGLKNHGLTITGTSLPEIMERVRDRLMPQIPMN